MTHLRIFVGSALVAAAVAFAPSARAQGPSDQTTYVTFNSPVELPGVALPAGTYIFRLPDPGGAHDVVQVLSADRSKVFAMVQGVERTRAEADSKVVATFDEGEASAPPAIRTFFFPYNSVGLEFMYPQHQAERIARSTGERVLTEDGSFVQ
jgi:hypothetical protein